MIMKSTLLTHTFRSISEYLAISSIDAKLLDSPKPNNLGILSLLTSIVNLPEAKEK